MELPFPQGVVVISIDTEQRWGYLDLLSAAQFEARFPNTEEAHARLLERLCAAGVGATWFVVGGLALRGRADALDRPAFRFASRRFPGAGDGPLWYNRPFLESLRDASPAQEIGLHGGLVHLVWDRAGITREVAARELSDGVRALASLGGEPRAFSYPRNAEAFHDLLPRHGLCSFRGGPPSLASRLGPSLPGALLRAFDELRRGTPPPVWPSEYLPGLWNVPSSMFLYPIGPARARFLGLGSRVERFRRGVEAAARHRAVFHFCLHPENLAESPCGFSVLDGILETLVRARERGDVEVITMTGAVARMERKQCYARKEENHS